MVCYVAHFTQFLMSASPLASRVATGEAVAQAGGVAFLWTDCLDVTSSLPWVE